MGDEENIVEEEEVEEEITESPRRSRLGIFIILGLSVLILGAVLFALKIVPFSLPTNQPTKIIQQKDLTEEERRAEKARIQAEQVAKAKAAEKKKKSKKTKYLDLYTNLTDVQWSNVLRELSLLGIRFQSEQKGQYYNVQVEEGRLEEAKSILAIKGLPTGGSKGYEIFDNASNLGVTEFDKRIRFIRAISGELEKAIMQFDAIRLCKVQIVMPEQKLFSTKQPPVTASILLSRSPHYPTINDEVVLAVIELVSNAVENLQPENVSVIDTEGFVLSKGLFKRLSKKPVSQPKPKPKIVEKTIEKPKEKPIPKPKIQKKQGQIIKPDLSIYAEKLAKQHNYENLLKAKAEKRLSEFLPIGTFKIDISTEFKEYPEKGIPKPENISAYILLDGTAKIKYSKDRVIKTVAHAIGYKKNRDIIRLTISKKPIYSSRTKVQLEQETMVKSEPVKPKLTTTPIIIYQAKYFMKKHTLVVPAVLLGFISFIGVVLYLLFKRQPEEQEPEPVEEEVQEEEPSTENNERIATLREKAAANPRAVAQIMEGWLSTVSNENGF